MELILFIGLQGSGKSSFYRERFAGSHVLVSKDLWPHARRREARQRRLISEALAAGRPVVVDNTNPTVEGRAPLIALGKSHGARVVGYAFESRLEDCLARNARREGHARVPEVALYGSRGDQRANSTPSVSPRRRPKVLQDLLNWRPSISSLVEKR